MGYFSNGTEGEMFEARWCERCVHQDESEDSIGCPVWWLHLMWNQEWEGIIEFINQAIRRREYEVRNENHNAARVKQEALDMFIPLEGIYNGECRMFHEEAL